MKLQAEFFASVDGTVMPKAKPLPRRDALRIYRRDRGTCQKCGIRVKFGGTTTSPFDEIKAGAVDHIFARARGGQNDDCNLRLLCITCNAQKGAR
jgi:5-methylcytosine-specific restriction endonuclease McrA